MYFEMKVGIIWFILIMFFASYGLYSIIIDLL
jgi:hypothetical protein